jgi:hypothetical protein
MESTHDKAGSPPAPGAKSDAQKNLKSIPMEELQKKLGSSRECARSMGSSIPSTIIVDWSQAQGARSWKTLEAAPCRRELTSGPAITAVPAQTAAYPTYRLERSE